MSEEGVTQEIKKTKATWVAYLFVDCPYCGTTINLLDTDDWRDDWHHKFGALENKTGINAEVECPKCKLLFVVENVEW